MSNTECTDRYVIGDLDGYWTIVEAGNRYLVSKFNSSGSIHQVELNSLEEAEGFILKIMYSKMLEDVS
jgi:hypothetical protein